MIIKNAEVYGDDCRFQKGNILIKNDEIIRIQKDPFNKEMQGEDDRMINAKNLYAIPGLIDIHLHGAMNHDFCNANHEVLQAIAEYELQQGVTSFLCATMAQPVDILMQICKAAAEYDNRSGSEFLGINMEAPFISAQKRGAQNEEYLQKPDVQLFLKLQEASNGHIKIVGVAPELEGAEEFIKELHNKVIVSAAHTAADYDTAKKAFSLGIRHVTHLFNAMPVFHHRTPGVIGAAFEDKSSMVEMICDGNFVHPCVVKMMFQAFTDDRIIMISDSMPAAGLPDGEYLVGGDTVIIKDCVGYMASDGAMAGPAMSVMGCMRASIKKAGISLESAVKSVTKNPAKALGIYDKYGSITKEKYANIVLLDQQLNIKAIIYKGKIIKNDINQ